MRLPSGLSIVRSDDYRELYAAAIADKLPAGETGSPVPSARPEYIFAMKIAADRGIDRADVEAMIVGAPSTWTAPAPSCGSTSASTRSAR